MNNFVKNQKGFTLVELAIVLVIIGIILGGVIKGQELINNAKVKKIPQMHKEISAAVYAYQDRYRFLPGDDSTATTRWATARNGNADGQIAYAAGNYLACAAGTNNDACGAWEHMRQAGFLSGSGRLNPQHAYAGNVGVGYMNGTTAGYPTIAGNWLAFDNIPVEVAEQIDTQFDDGNRTAAAAGTGWNTGTVQTSATWVAASGTLVILFMKM